MRMYIGILCVLFGIGIILMTRGGNKLTDGQAGYAYTENEDGELVVSDGTRANAKVEIDGSDEEWLTKWQLTERSGEKISNEDLAGKPYVAGFFFSTCPSICVQQNTKVKELQDQFKGEAVRFLSISCDPEVDTPDVLTEYAKKFNADSDQWLFFTGKMNYIRRVGSEFFRLGVERRGHPEKFAVIDSNGKPFGWYTWSDAKQWETLKTDLDKLIAAGGAIDSKDSEMEQADQSTNGEAEERQENAAK